jgi:hypothetical protein
MLHARDHEESRRLVELLGAAECARLAFEEVH